TMVAVEGEHTAAVLKSLRGIPEVQALHTTNGRWDIVVELGVESLEAFDQALQRIRPARPYAGHPGRDRLVEVARRRTSKRARITGITQTMPGRGIENLAGR